MLPTPCEVSEAVTFDEPAASLQPHGLHQAFERHTAEHQFHRPKHRRRESRLHVRMFRLAFQHGFPLARERSEEHTSELQSRPHLVCRLLLEKKKQEQHTIICFCSLTI